ncbi:MAG: SDR family oxidoreductase [Acidimicrobiia bacterium]|nr:SDR family oxidoreductase [Acidimicrobiia bacterium]
MTFRGKVALVTGAASGMGRLSAWRLAADGVAVGALDVDEAGLAETARRAPSITPITCDVADAAAVAGAVARVEAVGPIERVVSAAAIAPTQRLLHQDVDEIRRMTEVNYLGSVHVIKATLPAMLERGRGDLIQYASLAGWLPAQLRRVLGDEVRRGGVHRDAVPRERRLGCAHGLRVSAHRRHADARAGRAERFTASPGLPGHPPRDGPRRRRGGARTGPVLRLARPRHPCRRRAAPVRAEPALEAARPGRGRGGPGCAGVSPGRRPR